jgi:hypothetical protein
MGGKRRAGRVAGNDNQIRPRRRPAGLHADPAGYPAVIEHPAGQQFQAGAVTVYQGYIVGPVAGQNLRANNSKRFRRPQNQHCSFLQIQPH